MRARARDSFTFGGVVVRPGHRGEVDLPIARLVTGTQVSLPVMVIHGRADGPTAWINAAIHGDEIGGVEIIQRVLATVGPRELRGTLLAVPIVNLHGFMNGDRYLPDRRDLNRSFPGSPRGSLAARIAHLFMTEVVARSSLGIDLHTGSDHRTNLPQIRADLDDPATRELAVAFGPPLMIHAKTRDGSLRHAATQAGATVLLYEGGEAWRFDEQAVAVGTSGVLRVLGAVEMIDRAGDGSQPPMESRRSTWVRAQTSGILHMEVAVGDRVRYRANVGTITDSFGRRLSRARSPLEGIVIGHTQHPLVNRGDAVCHVAEITDPAGSDSPPG